MAETVTPADQTAYKLYAAMLRMRDPSSGMGMMLVLSKLLQVIADGGHLPKVNADAMAPDQAAAAQRFVDWLNSQTPG